MAIARLPVGRTSDVSTPVVFGGAALGAVSQEATDRTLDLLLAHGITHIETVASHGEAERRIGPWLKRGHGYFFLATKMAARRAADAREDLLRSLDRLGVDHVDLWQLLSHVLAAAEHFEHRPPDAEMQAMDERLRVEPLFV